MPERLVLHKVDEGQKERMPERLVLHKVDEGQKRKDAGEISPS
ncbi:hypothetical protein QNH20_23450 [Neobacillus sp. WH10]|nr:hypothetical protein [Neobacillus sp. WH10]WHY77006.1 hypothetical protein QNH20_23450 [Neobacillus sp. WH10]